MQHANKLISPYLTKQEVHHKQRRFIRIQYYYMNLDDMDIG
jgi:hypothetical protein